MQIHYALYERLTGGYGWSWHSNELPKPLRNDFFHRITLPNDSNTIELDDLRGGIYRFDKWTILYRFFNGGKDEGGRPNRIVMLTAWISTQDLVDRNVDLLQIFHNKTFQWVQEHSKTVGIDRPFALNETIHLLEPPIAITVDDAVYNDFLYNLADKDNDYNLLINNKRLTLEKKTSALFKENETKVLIDVPKTPKQPQQPHISISPPLPPKSPPKPKFLKFVTTIIILFIVLFIVILGFGIYIAKNGNDISESGPTNTSPQTLPEIPVNSVTSSKREQIMELFQQLPSQEQEKLLDELKNLYDNNSQKDNLRNDNYVPPKPNSKPSQIKDAGQSPKESPQRNRWIGF
jgi:hypothetical protein